MRGTTLIELLVSLAVAGILLSWAGAEATHLVTEHRATAAVNQILGAVRFARHAAVTYRSPVTVCPAGREGCGRRDHWHDGILVFLDRNADGRLDEGEGILRRLPRLDARERIYWRSFRNRSYLSLRPSGLTDWQNGSFLLCPGGGDPRQARQLIVNAQARVRHARDADGDGIREDASGRPLACP